MSRGQVRFVVAVATLLLLTTVGYHLLVNMRAQQKAEKIVKEMAADLSATADQRMQDFRRFKVRDGKKVWEIAAQQAWYLKDRNEVIVDAPEFSLYLKDGETMALRSKEAHVYLNTDGREIMRVELKGGLEMQLGDFSVKTQEAVFESDQNTIFSSGAVQISGPGLLVEGQGYTVDVEGKRLTLNADVQTTVSRSDG